MGSPARHNILSYMLQGKSIRYFYNITTSVRMQLGEQGLWSGRLLIFFADLFTFRFLGNYNVSKC